jgi:hypothetical protein
VFGQVYNSEMKASKLKASFVATRMRLELPPFDPDNAIIVDKTQVRPDDKGFLRWRYGWWKLLRRWR